jgi:hypothetical protein
MKIRISALLFVLFLVPFSTEAQQYLVVEKTGTVKNFKYSPGNDIDLLVNETRLKGTITQLTDSTLTLDYSIIVQLQKIKKVYRFRGFVYKFSIKALILSGLAYMGMTGFNGMLHNEYPLVDKTTAIIGLSMMAAGFLMKPFYYRKIPVDGRWQLKVIDFDALD